MPLWVRTHPCHEWTTFYTPLYSSHPSLLFTNFSPFGECSPTPLKASSFLIPYPTNDGIPNFAMEYLAILLSICRHWVRGSTRLTAILTETFPEYFQTNSGEMLLIGHNFRHQCCWDGFNPNSFSCWIYQTAGIVRLLATAAISVFHWLQ